jgi:hypothetical protein
MSSLDAAGIVDVETQIKQCSSSTSGEVYKMLWQGYLLTVGRCFHFQPQRMDLAPEWALVVALKHSASAMGFSRHSLHKQSLLAGSCGLR